MNYAIKWVCRGCITAGLGLCAEIFAICMVADVAGAATTRVASINLCSDQYLIALAAPGQAVSVTALAANSVRSAESRGAGALSVNHGSAEEIAAIGPDLVLADGFSDPGTVALTRRIGVKVLVLADPTDFAGIFANVRLVAGALGGPDRGETAIAAMKAAIAAPAARLSLGLPLGARPPVVAVLEPGGYTEGMNTLIDDAITHAGGVNLASRLGLRGYRPLPVERLVAAEVDLVVEPAESDRAPSLGFAQLRHPALLARFASVPRLAIPGNLTDCAAPASAALVPMLRAALARLGQDAPR